ncbi:ClpXP protease specificity-enhancing factor [Rhodoferax sp.]|uniref:ClpXP protease specificity-enhancing factor n=1 Tax=Rhodoferax sp. TaxID=50421 RepID=UPI0025FB175C|nr:ClpXP protease specificity-enhancing factor [Rhodoferax sp.]
MKPVIKLTSSQPYLIRAWHEWCTDNGLTPYVTVAVDAAVQVPREYVKDGEIVLNISYDSTTGMQLGNDYLAFKARFAGVVRDVMVPVDRVLAIFARENGQGMAFPKASLQPQGAEHASSLQEDDAQAQDESGAEPSPSHLASVPVAASAAKKKPAKKAPASIKTAARPTLTRIK